MQIGLLAAFLGGTLALLSPCSALLLPAFFASTVHSAGRMLVHGAAFYLGLLCTLVPLGLGIAAAGTVLVEHRSVMITVAGSVIILFGVLSLFGRGVDLRRWLPVDRTEAAARARVGLVRPLLLGMSSGVAGFCAGPILGAILTTAAVQPVLVGGVTMAVYAAGMVVPLLVVALSMRRAQPANGRRPARPIRLGRVRIHPVSLLTGLVLIAVGALFIATNGLIELGEILSADQLAAIQRWVVDSDSVAGDIALIVLGAAVVLTAWYLHIRRKDRPR